MPQVQKRLFASSIKNGGLPNISGNFRFRGGGNTGWYAIGSGGAFSFGSAYTGAQLTGSGSTNRVLDQVNFNASRYSTIYDSGTTVRPAAVYTNWCIKF